MVKFFKGTAAQRASSTKTGDAGDLVIEEDTGNIAVANGSTLLGALKRLARTDEVSAAQTAAISAAATDASTKANAAQTAATTAAATDATTKAGAARTNAVADVAAAIPNSATAIGSALTTSIGSQISTPATPAYIADRAAVVAKVAELQKASGDVYFLNYVSGTFDATGATDYTTELAAAIADHSAPTSGNVGALRFPSGVIKATTLTLPNDGATPPKQANQHWIGTAWHSNSRNQKTPIGGTVLNLTGTDTYGKIKTNGVGVLEIEGIVFKDSAGTSTPFIYTTNTTIHPHGCAFIGSKSGTNCDQDAIILGGTQQVEGAGGWDDGFQGYGTVIERNFFAGIRRAVFGRVYANGLRIENNHVGTTCGSNLTGGAAFEFDGTPSGSGQALAGGSIETNLIEVGNYAYGIVVRNTVGLSVLSNDCYDSSSTTIAAVRLEATANGCRVVAGYFGAGTKPYLIDESGLNRYEEMNASGAFSIEAITKMYRAPLYAAGNGGLGSVALVGSGEQAYLKAHAADAGGYPKISFNTRPAVTVTDGVTTSGSRTVTSATAAWAATDVGMPIASSGNIPSGAYITKWNSAGSVESSKAATATTTGATVTFARASSTETQQFAWARNHMMLVGTAPTITAGVGAGGSPTVAVVGTDAGGTITITTGTSPVAGTIVNIVAAIAFSASKEIPVFSAADANAADVNVYATRNNAASWKLSTGAAALAAATTYTWNYWVPQLP